ncbi:hypothetical protein H8D30_05205 [bacterium]|nr:hypothetical protein [bacterium]
MNHERTASGNQGFLLLSGPSAEENYARATKIASDVLGCAPDLVITHPDLYLVDLFGPDRKVGSLNFHPRYLRFWTDPPTNTIRLFRLPPRKGGTLIILIRGFDLLAHADATSSIQNRLLKPLEEMPPTHFVIGTATRKHLILPTILSRARHQGVEPPQQEEVFPCPLTPLALSWLEIALGTPAQKLLAASLLAGKDFGKEGSGARLDWLKQQGVGTDVLERLAEPLRCEVLSLLAEISAGNPGPLSAPHAQSLALGISAWHGRCRSTQTNEILQLSSLLFDPSQNPQLAHPHWVY